MFASFLLRIYLRNLAPLHHFSPELFHSMPCEDHLSTHSLTLCHFRLQFYVFVMKMMPMPMVPIKFPYIYCLFAILMIGEKIVYSRRDGSTKLKRKKYAKLIYLKGNEKEVILLHFT